MTERLCWPRGSHGRGQAGRPELWCPPPAVLPKAGPSRPEASSLCPRVALWAVPVPTRHSPSGPCSEGFALPAEGPVLVCGPSAGALSAACFTRGQTDPDAPAPHGLGQLSPCLGRGGGGQQAPGSRPALPLRGLGRQTTHGRTVTGFSRLWPTRLCPYPRCPHGSRQSLSHAKAWSTQGRRGGRRVPCPPHRPGWSCGLGPRSLWGPGDCGTQSPPHPRSLGAASCRLCGPSALCGTGCHAHSPPVSPPARLPRCP